MMSYLDGTCAGMWLLVLVYVSISVSVTDADCDGLFCVSKCPQPPEFEDKYPLHPKPPYFVGNRVRYRCRPRCMMVGGSPMSRCTSNSSWTPPALRCQPLARKACRGHCRRGVCGRIPPAEGGTIAETPGTNGFSPMGTLVRYNCAPGYRHMAGERVYKCKKQGWWKKLHDNLRCSANCWRPDIGFSAFSDGRLWQNLTEHGREGPVRCTTGRPILCHNGHWVPEIAKCFKGVALQSTTQAQKAHGSQLYDISVGVLTIATCLLCTLIT